MRGDSFTFGSKNSLETWGIKVIAYDVFSAPKRERKQLIPFRNGTYDYGEKWYDNKIIMLDCCTEEKELSKADMRDFIQHMSNRNRLILWDEPEKYYIGEMMESADINILPKRVKQQFTLSIECQPFAYKSQQILPIETGVNKVAYNGTAETSTLIILKNNNSYPITNIKITSVQKIQQ